MSPAKLQFNQQGEWNCSDSYNHVFVKIKKPHPS